MASSLSAYLAQNYLTADTPQKKSKKRKRTTAAVTSTGLSIADDDAESWVQTKTSNRNADSNDDSPQISSHTQGSGSTQFRKKKSSQWQTLSGLPAEFANEEADLAAARDAEALIAQAAEENAARQAADDEENGEGPAIVDEEGVQRMSNGAHAGLQSADSMAKQIAQHKRSEAAAGAVSASGGKGETIYRDASGRVVNIAMKRAEARAAAAAKEEKKRLAEESARGDVQKAEREARKQELEDAKIMPFARTADDEQVNAELKAKEVWGDPMAGQLDGDRAAGAARKGKGEKVVVKKSISGRPLFKGAAPPNRYGIRPGHKWDGVDRGVGFEGEWFKARNTKRNKEQLRFEWQMDE